MTAVRTEIRFLLNDREERLTAVRSSDTLLDHLRLARRLTRHQGGLRRGRLRRLHRARRPPRRRQPRLRAGQRLHPPARLGRPLPRRHRRARRPRTTLHPIQTAMVDLHGSPVRLLHPRLRHVALRPLDAQAEGQRGRDRGGAAGQPLPLHRLPADHRRRQGRRRRLARRPTRCSPSAPAVRARLDALDDGARVDIRTGDDRVVVPATVDDLAAVLVETAEADDRRRHDRRRPLDHQVHAQHLPGGLRRPPRRTSRRIEVGPDGVTIGAGVSYDDFQATLDAEFPHVSDYWRRIGGWQVRAMGTVGGNIANGSPIGDTPPTLIALGATVTLRSGAGQPHPAARGLLHRLRQAGPATRRNSWSRSSSRGPPPGTLNATYKVTKRRDEDISAVACGFHVALEGRHGRDRPPRLRRHGRDPEARRRRRGRARRQALDARNRHPGRGEAFAEDFTPLTDWRASADYRALRRPQPAAPVLPRIHRRNRPAQARGGSLMPDTLDLPETIRGGVHVEQRHDSAHKHVTGFAEYTDDVAEPIGTLHAYLGLSDKAHAEIVSIDLDAVRAAPGVVDVLTAADIPHNDVSPVGKHDDPVFAEKHRRVPRPAALRRRRRDPRRRPPRRDARQGRVQAPAPRHRRRRGDRRRLPLRHRAAEARARRRRRRDGRRAAPPQGRAARRRPGPFLPRGHDRLRASPARTTTSPSTPRPSTRPRCSTWSPTSSASPRTP